MQHFSVTMAEGGFGAGWSPAAVWERRGRTEQYLRCLKEKSLISKFRVFILFIIYEKCRKFNELFRRDIPMDFVQLQLTHAEFNIFNCTKEEKKLRMDHHTKLFENYSIQIYR